MNDAQFDRLFLDFEHTAFRLEAQEFYAEPYEAESLRQFVGGEEVDLGWFGDWLAMIRQATAQGRQFTRVRVVSLPLTDYSRFGVYCSQFTNAAGEDIRYLPRDRAVGLPGYDYWLFDSRKLARMHFESDMTFLGAEVITDPAVVVQHCHWRDAAWHRAVRRDDFAAE
ncbi:DUF6879 family protein [Parafrankia elaeagni]|uniref:DUF6879 family protein n=1 Tax=Parafrankia elaeagni TaxID=222534 RepID=UPI002DDB7D14|nr:DUF6879 family protein [Parafrankia elaeagni]